MTTKTLIEVKGLEKHFGKGTVRALNGVDAEIRQGEKLVVIGPSGSGKSTFLRCLNRLEEPTGGHIFFDGVDITSKREKGPDGRMHKLNLDRHRQKMGMVFYMLEYIILMKKNFYLIKKIILQEELLNLLLTM